MKYITRNDELYNNYVIEKMKKEIYLYMVKSRFLPPKFAKNLLGYAEDEIIQPSQS